MNKVFKKILILALSIVCALSLFACADSDKRDAETGLFCKNISGVYTIHKYVDDGETVSLDIAKELARQGITDTNIKIQTDAFKGNDSLTEIIVPSSVTKIEKGAFAGMKKLEKLSVPFIGMTSCSDVSVGDTADDVDKSVDAERTIAHLFGESEYDEGVAQTINYGTGSSTASDGTTTTQATTCYMPLTLTEITVTGDYNVPMCAFNGLTKYLKINLTGNVSEIGEYAFANAIRITDITLPTSLTKIGNGAFSGATKLGSVNFDALTSLTVIGESAFEKTGLTTVKTSTLLDTSKTLTIGKKAFMDCKSLTELTLSASVESINHYAFRGCEKLVNVYTDGVNSLTIGNLAFSNCEKLNYLGLKDNQADKTLYTSTFTVGIDAFDEGYTIL